MDLIACFQLAKLERKVLFKNLLFMNVFTAALLMLCMSASGNVFSQRVSLSEKNVHLSKIFDKIKKQTGYTFIYSEKLLKEAKVVTVSVYDASLTEVLDACFANQPFTYSILNRMVIVKERQEVVSQLSPLEVSAVDITGRVTDNEGNPLGGVSILVKGTSQGTTSDDNGRFSLQISDRNVSLVVSFTGYLPQEIKVGQQTNISISLQLLEQEMQDIVVVGYGTQKRGNITGAVSAVSSKELEDMPVATIGQKLQGKLSGVRVMQTSGRPGEGMKFQVRGAVSLTAGADPLYVIDGMPISGDINFLNPDEIENISVLKDPASASMYGSRSANGVILITTKSGKSDRVNLNFNSYYGIEKVPQSRTLKMMDGRQYAQFQKEIAETNGRPVDPFFENPEQYGDGTNWFNMLTRTGAIQSYNLSLNAGTQKFKTSATIGYYDQEGVVVNTGFKRISLRINNLYKPTERITIGLNVAPTQTISHNFNTDGGPYGTENIVSSGIITTPLASPYNADGTLALTASDPATFGNPNWLRVAHDKVYRNKDLKLLSNAYVEYKILSGLTAKTTMNLQTGNQNIFQFNPSTIGALFSPPPRIPSGRNDTRLFYNWMNENTINYNKALGDHQIEALVGFTAQKYRYDGTFVTGTNYPDDRVQTINAASQTLVASDVQKWALLSLISRVNYSYKNKYLLQASFRRDGSSRFGENNRWGNFPAVSAGWVISHEDFWNVDNPISYLKLRGSYGVTGNFEIGNFTHITTLSNTFYAFNNTVNSGAVPSNLGDKSLGWENNKQSNVGVDVNFFNNKLQLSYNFYTRRTTDLLFNVSVPLSSGYSNLQSNIGELKFWGHEISANAVILKNNQFNWDANLNISFDRNRAVSLATSSGVLPSGVDLYGFLSHRTIVGRPILQFYGAVWDGVYVNQDDFDKSPKNEASQVGTIKYRDLNGDGVITFPEDMELIGNPWPKFTFGLTNSFRYKNFDLSFVLAGSYGNQIVAFYENWATNLDGVFNVLEEVQHRWKSESDPGHGRYGSVEQGTTFLERDRWSSRYLQDGSFISLKNFQLGYDLTSRSNKMSTRVYVSLQNALILTKYKGGNPEVNTRNSASGATPGFDDNSYPLPRTISFGVNFNLR